MDIEEAYQTVKETLEEQGCHFQVYAEEGRSGLQIPETRDYPQTVGIEYLTEPNQDKKDEVELELLRRLSGTGWDIEKQGIEVFIFRNLEENPSAYTKGFERSENIDATD